MWLQWAGAAVARCPITTLGRIEAKVTKSPQHGFIHVCISHFDRLILFITRNVWWCCTFDSCRSSESWIAQQEWCGVSLQIQQACVCVCVWTILLFDHFFIDEGPEIYLVVIIIIISCEQQTNKLRKCCWQFRPLRSFNWWTPGGGHSRKCPVASFFSLLLEG